MTNHDEISEVTLLLTVTGQVCSIYQNADNARLKMESYNADPYIDGEPDTDAPYSIKTWRLLDIL